MGKTEGRPRSAHSILPGISWGSSRIAPRVGGAPRAAFLCRFLQLLPSCFPNPKNISTQEMWDQPSPKVRAGNQPLSLCARGDSGGESRDQRWMEAHLASRPQGRNTLLIPGVEPPPRTGIVSGRTRTPPPPQPQSPSPRHGVAGSWDPKRRRSAAAAPTAGHGASPKGSRAHE